MIRLIITLSFLSLSFISFTQEFGQFTDHRDGKTYKTVKIGKQIWMAENLAFKTDSGCWAYNDDTSNVIQYGYLYNWTSANKVCPSGWRLPTRNEFETLRTTISHNNNSVYNSFMSGGRSGFSALLCGLFYFGEFCHMYKRAAFWSSTSKESFSAFHFDIREELYEINTGSALKPCGFSVRCIKD